MEVENVKPTNVRPVSTPQTSKKRAVTISTPSRLAITTPARPMTASSFKSALSTSKKALPVTPGSCRSVSRDSARLAKLQSTTEKMNKVAELKEKWAKEKKVKRSLFEEKRALELKSFEDANQKATEARRKAVMVQQQEEQKKKELEKELLASSLEARKQLVQDLTNQKKMKKRQSVLLNKEMMTKFRQNATLLAKRKKEQEDSFLESKRIDFLQTREAKKADEERRRESLCERGRVSQEQRGVEKSLEIQQAEEEKSLLEFRKNLWNARRDDLRDHAERRRESLACRMGVWRTQKDIENDLAAKQAEQEKEFLETRREDWIEKNKYKRGEDNKRRESMAFRLDHWRQERVQENKDKSEAQEAAEIELQLQQQQLEDVKEYEEKLKSGRRESLAYRLEQARKDKEYDRGVEALKSVIEEEEQRLELQDRDDIENHRKAVVEARRQSLVFRGQLHQQERERAESTKQLDRIEEEEEFKVREEDWRAVKAYQEEQRAQARKSIAERLVVARKQQEGDLERHRQALDTMHEDFQKKHQDWEDVKALKDEQKKRSRQSIAFRLDSWRRDRMVEEMLKSQKEYVAAEEARQREEDREAVYLAKEQLMAQLKLSHLTSGMIH